MSHQTTAVLVFAAFYVLWRVLRGDWNSRRIGERGGFALAGALCGATVAAEYTGALPVLAVVLYGRVVATLAIHGRFRSLRSFCTAMIAVLSKRDFRSVRGC